MAAHVSPAFRVEEGDQVTVGQCRPLSKTVCATPRGNQTSVQGESADILPLGPIQRSPCPPKNRKGRQVFQQILSDEFLNGSFRALGFTVVRGYSEKGFDGIWQFQRELAWDKMKTCANSIGIFDMNATNTLWIAGR